MVTNQFGQATLVTGTARLVCLPSFKDTNNPPHFPSATQPAGLDHFTCYDAHYGNGSRFNVPAGVSLKDQFGSFTPRIGGPNLLCLPSQATADPSAAGDSAGASRGAPRVLQR